MARPSPSATTGNYRSSAATDCRQSEVGGILLCLSCHDGNLTSKNMMANQSYEQRIGLLTNTAYGSQPIPTLLGSDGTTVNNTTTITRWA